MSASAKMTNYSITTAIVTLAGPTKSFQMVSVSAPEATRRTVAAFASWLAAVDSSLTKVDVQFVLSTLYTTLSSTAAAVPTVSTKITTAFVSKLS